MLKKVFIFLFLFFSLSQIVFGNNNFLEGSNLENKIIKNNVNSPDFQIKFQRPSYIEDMNGDKIIYKCDEDKEECKVNFNLIKLNGKNLSTKLKCELKTDFESNQFNRCNPNTVIFPKGIHEIIIKVSEKNELNNFSIRKIVIINGKINFYNKYFEYLDKLEKIKIIQKNIISSEVIISDEVKIKEENIYVSDEENNSRVNLGIIFTEKIEIPDFNYIFQRPSYILEKEIIKNKYFCDKSKEQCKINLKLETKEGKDISSKFLCEIKIIGENYGKIINKCNPTTEILEKNIEYKINFKIYQKDLENNFKEKEIFISNIEKEEEVKNNDSESSSEGQKNVEMFGKSILDKNIRDNSGIISTNSGAIIEKKEEKTSGIRHYLPYTKIEVQGRIGKNKKLNYKNFICLTYKTCSINFTSGKLYKSQREGISFYWDFGNGEKYYGYNPKSVKFLPGEYRVKLKVIDNYGNKKMEIFKVIVKKKFYKKEIKENKETLENIINYKKFIFELGKDELQNNFIKNNISLSTENFIPLQILEKNYFKKQKKKLVKIFKYKNLSKKITVKNIFGKGKKIKLVKSKKNKKKILKLSTESFNPLQSEKEQEIAKLRKLRKKIKLRISFQKKNLKISGITIPKSKVIIEIGEKEYFLFSDKKGKYVLKTHNLKAGNYKILASVYDKKGALIAQKYSKEKLIKQSYINKIRYIAYKKGLKKYNQKLNKKTKKYLKKIKQKSYKIVNNLRNTNFIGNKNLDFFKKIFILEIIIGIISVFMIIIVLNRKKII